MRKKKDNELPSSDEEDGDEESDHETEQQVFICEEKVNAGFLTYCLSEVFQTSHEYILVVS